MFLGFYAINREQIWSEFENKNQPNQKAQKGKNTEF